MFFELSEDIVLSFEYVDEVVFFFFEGEGKEVCLIFGMVYGEELLVKVFLDMFYLDVVLFVGVVILLFDNYEDCGVYVVEGSVFVVG